LTASILINTDKQAHRKRLWMPACGGKGEINWFYLFRRWMPVCAGTVDVSFAL